MSTQEILERAVAAQTSALADIPFRRPYLHAQGQPFCYDALCPCKALNWLKHLWEPSQNGLLTSSEAQRLLEGRQVP